MLKGSKEFIGFEMSGHYTLSIYAMAELAEKSGRCNLLNLHHMLWVLCSDMSSSNKNGVIIYSDKYYRLENFVKKMLDNSQTELLSRLTSRPLEEIWSWLKKCHAKEVQLNSYGSRRRVANIAIKNEKLRTEVFKRDGEKCLKCGTSKNLSIDHITSVKNGGGNDVKNLQTLCSKCNPSKGCK